MKINVGVIGLGWWGPKLLRNVRFHPGVGTVIGCDLDPIRRRSAEDEYQVRTMDNPLEVVHNPTIEAIVVATPPMTHYEIARGGLEHGKHVLLTKPPTLTVAELVDLIRISEQRKRVLMLDSAFVYASPTGKIKELLLENGFQTPTSVHSFRHGNDLHFHHIERLQNTMIRNGIDVVEDLLFHDLALLTYLFQEKFRLGSIRRFYNLHPSLCDTAIIELESDHFPIHLSLSWTLPERKRQLLLFLPGHYLLFDDLRETGKLRRFTFEDKAEEEIPYDSKEPLSREIDHFISCILNGHTPLTGGAFMLQVMELYDRIRHAKT